MTADDPTRRTPPGLVCILAGSHRVPGDGRQRRGSGIQETVTVRKISQGVAIERIFPVHSPRIAKIENLRQGRVRRARLFYLRGRKGRSARIREKR